jgi:hypothetical protein
LENVIYLKTGGRFNGTQVNDLDTVLANYVGRVWEYPLYRPLYDFEETRLTNYLASTLSTPYDKMGAFRSAGVGFSFLESLLRQQDLHHIFCSEWVASALSEIGIMPTEDAARWNPNHLVRYLRWHEALWMAVALALIVGCKPDRSYPHGPLKPEVPAMNVPLSMRQRNYIPHYTTMLARS